MEQKLQVLHKSIVTRLVGNTISRTKQGEIIEGGIIKMPSEGDGFENEKERYKGLLELEKRGYIKLCNQFNPNQIWIAQLKCIELRKRDW